MFEALWSIMNILISWVFTLWLFLFYFQAYETLKECDWTKEDHYRIMKMCVWPLLNPQTSDKETNQQQYQYLSKTVDLFKCWIRHYTHLFFLEVSIFLLLPIKIQFCCPFCTYPAIRYYFRSSMFRPGFASQFWNPTLWKQISKKLYWMLLVLWCLK